VAAAFFSDPIVWFISFLLTGLPSHPSLGLGETASAICGESGTMGAGEAQLADLGSFYMTRQNDARAALVGIPLVRFTTEIFAPALTMRHRAT